MNAKTKTTTTTAADVMPKAESNNDKADIMAYLNRIAETKPPKAKGGAERPVQWVGTVTPNTDALPAMQAFMSDCKGLKAMTSMIRSLNKAIVEGNGSHTFDDVASVEEFDRKVVFDQYLSDHCKKLKSRENPRLGHAWGYAMIGKASFNDCSKSTAMRKWVAKYCDADGKLAFYKIS